ncbi:MAG: single-stranded DNA-binding protein [Candidatus Peribacteraceae bacterium]|jgi:single-strand DNA-binding protein
MANVNCCILAGNLTRAPEVKFSQAGTAICNISLAVNSKRKSGDQWIDEVSYFDLVAFGKTAEAIGEYVGKGQSILAECRAKQERWEKEGVKKQAVRFQIDRVHFLSPKKDEAAAAGQDQPPDDDIPL